MVTGVVLLLQTLDLRLRIAARLLEVLRCVIKLILIEFELRFGDIELVLQVVLLRFRRRGEPPTKDLDTFLIVLQRLLGFGLAIGNLSGFRGKLDRRFLDSAQRVKEGQIDFVVRDFHSLVRESLLFRSAGHRCLATRCLEWMDIDELRLCNRSFPSWELMSGSGCRRPLARRRQLACRHQSDDGCSHQQQQHDRGDPTPHFHNPPLYKKMGQSATDKAPVNGGYEPIACRVVSNKFRRRILADSVSGLPSGVLMKPNPSVLLTILLLLVFIPARAQTSEQELQLGVVAYKDNHYQKATEHFQKATQLDPNNINAHLYLATSCTSQYIPGVDTPDNIAEADHAIAEYQRVLDLNASNEQRVNSCKGIAYLYLNMKLWDDARKYYQMARDLDPKDPEPYYSMGVIAWIQCYQPRMEARARLGIRPDQQLSAKNSEQKNLCEQLRAKNWSVIEDGISQLDKAIELHPGYDDAMAYMNLMYRERADLECGDQAARSRDLKTADEWVDKAVAIKTAKAERAAATK